MAAFSSNTNRSDSTGMSTHRLDETALQREILSIRDECGDIDPDLIAVIFHECDYNTQTTIERIKAGDYEDGGWQTAKSNNKKKNHNQPDQVLNGGAQSDSERSLSQRTSPTSSLRGERQRKGQHLNTNRRGNYSKPRYPPRNTNPKPIEVISPVKMNEEITPTTSSSTDEYEFIGGTSQSLTFDNSLKKSPLLSLTKRRTPSTIPHEPVSMHPTIQFSIKPLDVQFGDIQWNDSIPMTITPSNSPMLTNQQLTDIQDTSSTNRIDSETTNPLSSSSIDETSHLSDQLIDSSQQQQPSSSTSNPSPTSQTTNPFLFDTTNPSVPTASAFTPYSMSSGTFQSIPRDYPQTWNQPQSTNYKPNTKIPMVQQGNYPQQTPYSLPHQQQIFLGTYPYGAHTVYPVITPMDHSWSTAGYDPYSTYPATNYLPTYSTQQAYHPTTKHEQHSYDNDYFLHYGQTRPSNTDIGNSSQSTKDPSLNSKLSATAASFSQATSPAPAIYFNPNQVLFTFPGYYSSHQDRTMPYPSTDTRDNRNGASYGGNHRNYYHQQSRSHIHSTRHSQQ